MFLVKERNFLQKVQDFGHCLNTSQKEQISLQKVQDFWIPYLLHVKDRNSLQKTVHNFQYTFCCFLFCFCLCLNKDLPLSGALVLLGLRNVDLLLQSFLEYQINFQLVPLSLCNVDNDILLLPRISN